MKKMAALTAITVAATAGFSYAGMQARTGVSGSYHDMNYYTGTILGTGNKDVYNRVCVFCHTPHNAIIDDGNGNALPLWGNDLTSKTQTAYAWATPANVEAVINDPLIGPSRLCMSCHDGSLAVDAHISNGTTNNGTLKLSGSRAIGSNDSLLTKTHPIGFDYVAIKTARNNPKTIIDGVTTTHTVSEVVDEAQGFATDITFSTTAGTYNSVIRAGDRSIKSVLYNGTYMTCATCHEVHNKENAIQDPGPTGVVPNYFLYAKEANSLICLSCHVK